MDFTLPAPYYKVCVMSYWDHVWTEQIIAWRIHCEQVGVLMTFLPWGFHHTRRKHLRLQMKGHLHKDINEMSDWRDEIQELLSVRPKPKSDKLRERQETLVYDQITNWLQNCSVVHDMSCLLYTPDVILQTLYRVWENGLIMFKYCI